MHGVDSKFPESGGEPLLTARARPHLDGELEGRTATFPSSTPPPLARLAWKAYSGNLGANPIEVITRSTGDWTLIFLLVTLSVTPLRKLTGHLWLIRFWRMFYGGRKHHISVFVFQERSSPARLSDSSLKPGKFSINELVAQAVHCKKV
jgi:hypothetical protein